MCILDLDGQGRLVGIELLSVFGFAGASLALLQQKGLLTEACVREILDVLRHEALTPVAPA